MSQIGIPRKRGSIESPHASSGLGLLESRSDLKLYYNAEKTVAKPTVSGNFQLPLGNVPYLELADSFGYDSRRRANMVVLDNDTLAFVAGNYVRVYDLRTEKNTFLASTGGGSVSCLAVHPNRLCFASGETGNGPDVNIFGFPSCRLRKVLRNGTKREYVCLKFDPFTGDMLATQGGEPDLYITIWRWAEEVPLLRCKSNPQDVYNITFNEELAGDLVTCGQNHIRFWRMANTFTGLKLYGQTGRFGQRTSCCIEACIQFGDGKVLSGSEEGTLLLWEESLLKAEFGRERFGNCHRGQINQMFMHEGEVLTLGEDGYIRTWHVEHILYVDPSYCGQFYFIRPLQEILVKAKCHLMHMVVADPDDPECNIWYVQDKEGTIWHVDVTIGGSATPPKVLLQYHGGPVNACAVSPTSHLLATAGQDATLRFFDCIQRKELLCLSFSAPATSLIWIPFAIDPHAASVIVGFEDGVIRKIAFHGGGDVGENEVSVPLKSHLSQAFKAHKSRVTSIALSFNAEILATGGNDKIVFLFKMKRAHFEPVAWLYVPTSIRQLAWTPAHFSYQGLMVTCDEGFVLETQLNNVYDLKVADNLQTTDVQFKVFMMHSIKSELRHKEEIQQLRELNTKQERSNTSLYEENFEENEEISNKKEEEEWEPFIPETLSTILQSVYSSSNNCFWLSLGDYDTGYVYLCSFSETCVSGADIKDYNSSIGAPFLKKPIKSVPIPDCHDGPITTMKIDLKRKLVLFGFPNGRIRLVQIQQDADIDNLDAYWEIPVHDSKKGKITGIDFAFDDSFLITTAMDGNIFLFDHAGKLSEIEDDVASLPITTKHHRECSEDISAQALWFADDIDKCIQDEKIRKAEKSKKRRREALRELQTKLKNLLYKNQLLPLPYRLTRKQMLTNSRIEEEYNEKQKEKLAKTRKEYEWRSEKVRIMVEKMKTGFLRHEQLPQEIGVASFNGRIEVQSFRIPLPWPHFEQVLEKRVPLQETESSVSKTTRMLEEESEDSLGASMTDDAWKLNYVTRRRRSEGLQGTVARTLKMALDKAHKAVQKRAKRQAEWSQLNEEKLIIDKENPQDVHKIEHAKNTVGALHLKTDPEYALKMSESNRQEESFRTLGKLDKLMCDNMNEFNEKLRRLREEKLTIIHVVQVLDERLSKISCGTRSLAKPKLLPKEVPEKALSTDCQTLIDLKGDRTFFHDEDFDDSILKKYPTSTQLKATTDRKPSIQGIPPNFTYYKGERSKYPDIVKFVWDQTNPEYEKEDFVLERIDNILIGEADESEASSSFRRDINMRSRLQIDFEESMATSIVSYIMEEFDHKLRNLQKCKFELEIVLKLADLGYIEKLEEFLIDRESMIEEKHLKTEESNLERSFKKNKITQVQLKRQIAKKTEEHDEISKQLAFAWVRFQNACEDKNGTKMMQFLTQLYKRRVAKKKNLTSDDEEYDSDVESSDSYSLVTLSGDESSISLDLDCCPDTLQQELYDRVVDLQQERQLLDETQNRLKAELVILNNESEQKVREGETLRRTHEDAKRRLLVFYKHKIQMLNEIITCVPTHSSAICARVSDAIVVNRDTLRRLYYRVGELKNDIQEQENIMQAHTQRNLRLRRENRIFAHKVSETEKACEKEIVNKFGRLINLKQMELVTLNPKAENIRCRFLRSKNRQNIQIDDLNMEIQKLKEDLVLKTVLTTSYYKQKCKMEAEKIELEQRLDAQAGNVDVANVVPKGRAQLLSREKRELTQLVVQQTEAIHNCMDAISFLSRTDRPPSGRLPPIRERYLVQRMCLPRKASKKSTDTIKH